MQYFEKDSQKVAKKGGKVHVKVSSKKVKGAKKATKKGVKKAVQNINELVSKEIINKKFENYRAFDKAILEAFYRVIHNY